MVAKWCGSSSCLDYLWQFAVDVKVGDIFDQAALKIIAFNEYFDTPVDDVVISAKTLNGIYINNCVK